MKFLALITAFLISMSQPSAAQKLGLFMKELELKSKQAEANIMKYCKLPADLNLLIRRTDTAELTKLANRWIYDCKRILKEKGFNNKTTDYYLNMARSLTPTIRTLTQKDLKKYGEALEILNKRSNQP